MDRGAGGGGGGGGGATARSIDLTPQDALRKNERESV